MMHLGEIIIQRNEISLQKEKRQGPFGYNQEEEDSDTIMLSPTGPRKIMSFFALQYSDDPKLAAKK